MMKWLLHSQHTLQVMAGESVTDLMVRYSEILDYHGTVDSMTEADGQWEPAPEQ